jgi:recombination protein RecT
MNDNLLEPAVFNDLEAQNYRKHHRCGICLSPLVIDWRPGMKRDESLLVCPEHGPLLVHQFISNSAAQKSTNQKFESKYERFQMDNNNAITPYIKFRQMLGNDDVMKRFNDVLKEAAPMFIANLITVVSMDTRLKECEPTSILNSAMKAAVFDLSIDPSTGQAWLIPYRDHGTWKARFQPGWKGLIQLCLRSRQYHYLNATEIWEGQAIEQDQLTGNVRISGTRKSDQVIGYASYLELMNGFKHAWYMTLDEIHEHAKRYSQSYGQEKSGWSTHFGDMAKKTVLCANIRRYGLVALSPRWRERIEEAINDGHDGFDGEPEPQDFIDTTFVDNSETSTEQSTTPQPASETPKASNSQPSAPGTPMNGEPRPYIPAILRTKLQQRAANYNSKTMNEKQTGLLAAMLEQAFAGNTDSKERRHACLFWLFGHESLTEIDNPSKLAMLNDWILPKKDSGGEYVIDEMAAKELRMVYTESLKSQGQQEIPF